MTQHQIEAMKLALEALELNNSEWKDLANSGDSGYWKAEDQGHYQLTIEAITAIKEALAQPEQEPFGYFRYDLRLDAWVQNRAGITGTPFYTTPPQRTWVGLTDEEIERFYDEYVVEQQNIVAFARAIEAAHDIKE